MPLKYGRFLAVDALKRKELFNNIKIEFFNIGKETGGRSSHSAISIRLLSLFPQLEMGKYFQETILF